MADTDNLDQKNLRLVLEGNLVETCQRIAVMTIDRDVRQKALRIAELGQLRAGRYKARDERGVAIDFNAAGKNQLMRAIAQLEFDLQLLELTADALREEIAKLPEVGDREAEPEVAPAS